MEVFRLFPFLEAVEELLNEVGALKKATLNSLYLEEKIYFRQMILIIVSNKVIYILLFTFGV